jgi:hypothetical protein
MVARAKRSKPTKAKKTPRKPGRKALPPKAKRAAKHVVAAARDRG